jgi:hypothetical protein
MGCLLVILEWFLLDILIELWGWGRRRGSNRAT